MSEILVEVTKRQAEKLAITRPLEVLSDPQCPEDLWWRLAYAYPAAARESVLWDFMTLDLTRIALLQDSIKESWYETSYDSLVRTEFRLFTDQALLLLAAECANRVLPIWESWCSLMEEKHRDAPRASVEGAKRFALGLATAKEMDVLFNATSMATDAAETIYKVTADKTPDAAAWAAEATSWVSKLIFGRRGSAYWAADSAANSMTILLPESKRPHAREEFYCWAWERALAFYHAKPGLPPPWDTYA